jgi:outer membrane biosynthesis protein TonB
MKAMGLGGPERDFDEFAVGVVRNWKFKPATKEGAPVAVRLETEVRSHR